MAEQNPMVDIYVMGRHYQVPEGLTIMTALEYCGYRLVRGSGCRAGFCGACATVYNFKNDPQLRFDLACQKTVEPDMYLTQIPFFPAARALYGLEKIEPTVEQILALYPNLVASSIDPKFSLTIYNAASSAKTLTIMLIIATLGMPFVIAYTGVIYWMFRGKVEIGEHSY